jgi:hypothetical protein
LLDEVWNQIRNAAAKPLDAINLTIGICLFRELLVIIGFILPLFGGCLIALRQGGFKSYPVFAFLLPLVVLAAIFWWVPMVTPRYMQFIIPAYILLTALFLVKMWRKLLGIAVIAAMVILIGLSLLVYYFSPVYGKEDYRGAVNLVSKECRKGDLLVCFPGYIDCAVKYYYNGPCKVRQFDLVSAEHGFAIPAEGYRDAQGADLLREIESVARTPGADVWLVVRGTSSDAEKKKLKEFFETYFSNCDYKRFDIGWGVEVYRYYN